MLHHHQMMMICNKLPSWCALYWPIPLSWPTSSSLACPLSHKVSYVQTALSLSGETPSILVFPSFLKNLYLFIAALVMQAIPPYWSYSKSVVAVWPHRVLVPLFTWHNRSRDHSCNCHPASVASQPCPPHCLQLSSPGFPACWQRCSCPTWVDLILLQQSSTLRGFHDCKSQIPPKDPNCTSQCWFTVSISSSPNFLPSQTKPHRAPDTCPLLQSPMAMLGILSISLAVSLLLRWMSSRRWQSKRQTSLSGLSTTSQF